MVEFGPHLALFGLELFHLLLHDHPITRRLGMRLDQPLQKFADARQGLDAGRPDNLPVKLFLQP